MATPPRAEHLLSERKRVRRKEELLPKTGFFFLYLEKPSYFWAAEALHLENTNGIKNTPELGMQPRSVLSQPCYANMYLPVLYSLNSIQDVVLGLSKQEAALGSYAGLN